MRTPARVALVGAVVVGLATPQTAAHAADTVPPTVSIDVRGTATGGWYQDTADVTVTAGDRSGIDAGSSSITLTGAAQRTVELQEGTTSLQVTESGETTITVAAYDMEGNVRRSSATVRVDGVAPAARLVGLRDGEVLTVGDTRRVTPTCDDAHSGVASCAVSGVNLGPDGSLPTEAAGTHNLILTARDTVGHRTELHTRFTVLPRGTRPTAHLAPSRPADRNGWYRSPVDVQLRGTAGHPSVPLSSLTWWTDRDATRRSAGPDGTDVRVDREGATTVHAVATDTRGTDSESTSHVVRLDSVAPTAALGDPGTVRQGDRVAPVTRCEDEGSGPESCTVTTGTTAEGLIDTSTTGTRRLTLRSVDVAGNTTTAWRDVEVLPALPEPEPDRSTSTTLTAPATVSSRTAASVRVTVAHDVALSGGTVTVRDGSRVLASKAVEPTRNLAPAPQFSTVTTVTLPRLSVGTHRLTATFTSRDAASSTSAVRTVVAKSPATVRASSWKVSRKRSGSVKVSVAGRDAKASGTVRVMRGSKVLGSARLGSRGSATVRLARLPKGRQTLTVVYLGSSRVLSARATARVTVR